MNKSLFLAAIALMALVVGCSEKRFQKAEDGSEYKLISNAKGTPAIAGNFLELNILVKYKDSVLFSTAENGSPNFIPFDTMSLPKFFRNVHEGDSLIIKESTDSILAKGQGAPWMEKGNFIIQTVKVAKVHTTKEAADAAMKPFENIARKKAYDKAVEGVTKELKDNAEQTAIDDKILTDYFASKNISNAQKGSWGAYVVITTPGTGPNLGPDDVAEVNYTGKTLDDSIFDSNTDPKFNHVQPLYVDMSEFTVMPGWLNGLSMMNKGSKGKLYIPSTMGYGKTGREPKIKPNENLVFDIEITDVLTREQYHEKLEQQQQMMQMLQQQMQQQQGAPSGK